MIPHSVLKRGVMQVLNGVDVQGILEDSLTTLSIRGDALQIAEFLHHEDVVGRPGRAYWCPVAQYIDNRLGMGSDDMFRHVACVIPEIAAVPLMNARSRMPRAVTAFVVWFDDVSNWSHPLRKELASMPAPY